MARRVVSPSVALAATARHLHGMLARAGAPPGPARELRDALARFLGMATVANIRRGDPCDVLADRRTKWGNPWRITRHTTRAQAVKNHRDWLAGRNAGPFPPPSLEEVRRTFAGKRIGCNCAPDPCHCDNLADAANGVPLR